MPSTTAERRTALDDERIHWTKSVPFLLMHLMPLGILLTGIRWQDVALCAALLVVRMFFITAGFHRYFAHRSYKLGRIAQFVMALGGATSAQKGVLWWAGHHRTHHRYSDTPRDVHSSKRGFWWSHVGWILCRKHDRTPSSNIRDFARYPELVWLDRWHVVPAVVLGASCFFLGGASALFGGFFLSTLLLYHATFSINSLAHVFGSRRYETGDSSRNSFLLALITLGEGWHNNHHHYQSSANQGFYWWEIDITYYVLRIFAALGIARDLRTPPRRVLATHRLHGGEPEAGLAATPLAAGTKPAS